MSYRSQGEAQVAIQSGRMHSRRNVWNYKIMEHIPSGGSGSNDLSSIIGAPAIRLHRIVSELFHSIGQNVISFERPSGRHVTTYEETAAREPSKFKKSWSAVAPAQNQSAPQKCSKLCIDH